jgi:hypothetical protein
MSQTPPSAAGRRFMPLGGDLPIHDKKPFSGNPSFSPSRLSTSFVATRPSPSPAPPLPDIYTTCPELRKFTPLFALKPDPPPEPPRFVYCPLPVFHVFNPNLPIIRPYVFLPIFTNRHFVNLTPVMKLGLCQNQNGRSNYSVFGNCDRCILAAGMDQEGGLILSYITRCALRKHFRRLIVSLEQCG